jgi:hypothetical protein
VLRDEVIEVVLSVAHDATDFHARYDKSSRAFPHGESLLCDSQISSGLSAREKVRVTWTHASRSVVGWFPCLYLRSLLNRIRVTTGTVVLADLREQEKLKRKKLKPTKWI